MNALAQTTGATLWVKTSTCSVETIQWPGLRPIELFFCLNLFLASVLIITTTIFVAGLDSEIKALIGGYRVIRLSDLDEVEWECDLL